MNKITEGAILNNMKKLMNDLEGSKNLNLTALKSVKVSIDVSVSYAEEFNSPYLKDWLEIQKRLNKLVSDLSRD